MSCNKHPAVAVLLGLILGAALGPAFAASRPSLDGALTPDLGTPSGRAPATPPAPAPTHVPAHASASATTSSSAPRTAAGPLQPPVAAAPQGAAAQAPLQPPSQASQPSEAVASHLTLGEIDKRARDKLVSALGGTPDTAAASAPVVTTKPVASDAPPRGQTPNAPVYAPRAHVDPVAFLGAYSDGLGQHVLYQYNGSVYPALIGEKLLNGWIARRVDGQMVTVSEGRATRHVAMSGDAQANTVIAQPSPFGGGASLLGDLSQPLPRGMVGGPIIQSGR